MLRHVAALAIVATTALADPPAGASAFAAAGASISLDGFLNTAWQLEGGARLPTVPLALHASVARGGAHDADNGGDFWRVQGGVEGRLYRAMSFGFLGLSFGYQHQTWNPSDPAQAEEHRGPLVAMRAGYEGGTRSLRARAALEAYEYHRELVGGATQWEKGIGIVLGVGYGF